MSTIVDSAALESLIATATSQAGGVAARIEAETGSKGEINQMEIAAQSQKTVQDPVQDQPEALLKPDINPEMPSEIATSDVVKPDPKPLEPSTRRIHHDQLTAGRIIPMSLHRQQFLPGVLQARWQLKAARARGDQVRALEI